MTYIRYAPESCLPWSDHRIDMVLDVRGGRVCETGSQADAAYLTRAANAYPKLVAAVQAFTEASRGGDWGKAIDGGKELLSELGEDMDEPR